MKLKERYPLIDRFDYAVYCVVLHRALRHFIESESFCLLLVVDPSISELARLKHVTLRMILDEEVFNNFRPSKTFAIETDLYDAPPRDKPRFINIMSAGTDSVLAGKAMHFYDDTIWIPGITDSDVRIAAREFFDIQLSDDDAQFIAENLEDLSDFLRIGRPISRSVKLLRDYMEWQTKTAAEMDRPRPKPTKVSDGPLLQDLHGYGEAKDWGLELAEDMRAYKTGKLQWADVSKGLLLSGPPGCGKTTYAAALARTLEVPLILGSYGQWAAGHGQTDLMKKMRATFTEAAKSAPCVLFIDEVDSFPDRDTVPEWGAHWERQVVNGLLELIDGTGSAEGVVVIGACNNPSIPDPALKRPGRLDRHIAIPLPDAQAREGILIHHLGGQPDFDLTPIISGTEGKSGADLEKIARDARRIARKADREVRLSDLAEWLPMKRKVPPELIRQSAIHEAGHALVTALLGHCRITRIEIIDEVEAGVDAAIGRVSVAHEPHMRDRDYYLSVITTCLAGGAAEQIVYGRIFDGWQSDLQSATTIASYIETSLGFGSTLISDGVRSVEQMRSDRKLDPRLKAKVDQILKAAFDKAKGLLEKNRGMLTELSELLLRERSVDPEVLYAIIEKSKAPMRMVS